MICEVHSMTTKIEEKTMIIILQLSLIEKSSGQLRPKATAYIEQK